MFLSNTTYLFNQAFMFNRKKREDNEYYEYRKLIRIKVILVEYYFQCIVRLVRGKNEKARRDNHFCHIYFSCLNFSVIFFSTLFKNNILIKK